jgi:hypothetical protein
MPTDLFTTENEPAFPVVLGLTGDSITLEAIVHHIEVLDTIALDHLESDLDAVIASLLTSRKRVSEVLDRRDATPLPISAVA